MKSAETDRSMSDLVNEAVKLSLMEDAEDLDAYKNRVAEPDMPFADVLKELKQNGTL